MGSDTVISTSQMPGTTALTPSAHDLVDRSTRKSFLDTEESIESTSLFKAAMEDQGHALQSSERMQMPLINPVQAQIDRVSQIKSEHVSPSGTLPAKKSGVKPSYRGVRQRPWGELLCCIDANGFCANLKSSSVRNLTWKGLLPYLCATWSILVLIIFGRSVVQKCLKGSFPA